MNEVEKNELGIMGRIIAIFTAPGEAFESIDRKPTWLVPFIIGTVFAIGMQYMTLDIQLSDRMTAMENRGLTGDQIEAAQGQMSGAMKYIGMVVTPVFVLVIWAAFAGLILLASNMMLGGESSFKKVFSIVAWSGLVGVLNVIILTPLIISKGTANGVTLDLAALLPTPPLGEAKSLSYRILTRFDLFVFWQMALWVIGLALTYKTTIKKAVVPVLVLWLIYAVVAVGLGGLFSSLTGM